jgi:c-di-GMP-binding flagellar brake protein YcgR
MSPTGRGLEQTFRVGVTISLEYEEHGIPQFVLSRVEEAEGDRLWVAMPTRAGMFLALPVDTAMLVHIRKDEIVHTLHARVSGRRLQPTPMLELRPTSEIQRRPPREYVRLKIVLMPSYAALLGPDGGETRIAATIVNIGAGGVLLRTRQAVEVGQQARLSVELPGSIGAIATTVQALRVDTRRTDRGLYYEAGCVFVDLTDEERDLITTFIFRFQVRQRQESGAPS